MEQNYRLSPSYRSNWHATLKKGAEIETAQTMKREYYLQSSLPAYLFLNPDSGTLKEEFFRGWCEKHEFSLELILFLITQ